MVRRRWKDPAPSAVQTQDPKTNVSLSYGPPWAHYLDGYQDRLLGGPLGYSAWATRHLMAWGARTTVEKYSDSKLCMSCTM
jgi:hypothetical protein